MYNKTIIGFGLRMISRIIQTSVNVIRLSLRLRQITLTSVWIILDIMLSHPLIIYYREQQETAERNASRRGQHFDKLKQAEIPDMKG